MIAPPERKTIEEIFRQNVKYTVPKYQRSFDWGETQLQELMEDLAEIVRNKNKENLFLGTFIFDISQEGTVKIVDGQQRLTTLALIISTLENLI